VLRGIRYGSRIFGAGCPRRIPPDACKRIGTTDTVAPIPEALAPAVNQAFGTQLSVPEAVATTVYRCAARRAMVCTAGANLPCGKANSQRTPTAGVARGCRDSPNADYIPAFVTGHDTIYAWRCAHRKSCGRHCMSIHAASSANTGSRRRSALD